MIDQTAIIHDTAVVHESAVIGKGVEIGPFSVIGAEVEIGDNTWVSSHVVIKGPTKIGRGNKIFQHTSIGEDCQDKKYAGERTFLGSATTTSFARTAPCTAAPSRISP